MILMRTMLTAALVGVVLAVTVAAVEEAKFASWARETVRGNMNSLFDDFCCPVKILPTSMKPPVLQSVTKECRVAPQLWMVLFG
jgi:hypothetical protein